MQLLKTNSDGSGETIEEVPAQPTVAELIEYGRNASEGGFTVLLGGGFQPAPKLPDIPMIQAVFNNGAQIVCYIV